MFPTKLTFIRLTKISLLNLLGEEMGRGCRRPVGFLLPRPSPTGELRKAGSAADPQPDNRVQLPSPRWGRPRARHALGLSSQVSLEAECLGTKDPAAQLFRGRSPGDSPRKRQPRVVESHRAATPPPSKPRLPQKRPRPARVSSRLGPSAHFRRGAFALSAAQRLSWGPR
jgi:hypothetical protein